MKKKLESYSHAILAIRRSKTYRFLVEAFVMNTFSLAIAIPNELFIARMDLYTHIKTRILAFIMNTLLGRPYGVWRDKCVSRFALEHPTALRYYLADTIAFALFQLPLYWFNMKIGGDANFRQMISASITVTVIAGFVGRPYGVYLDFIRRKFGVEYADTSHEFTQMIDLREGIEEEAELKNGK